MKHLLILLVRFYRYFLSPFFGQHCRFYPTCSEYTLEALHQHGAVRGGLLSARRLCRCHPWHEGGVDLVPEKLAPVTYVPVTRVPEKSHSEKKIEETVNG